ncbi:MAG: TIGR03905 family TSCPD domain-containing protein [Ruminococcaceae bacterium]|nr:TIGR03905 family TSCPD domain-containing protein [Oscillospiraceae bacterium]
MDRFTYHTRGVCSRAIDIAIEDGIITEVRYLGGCSGNTQGVAALVRGMSVKDAIERLSGIRCGFKSTSCPDQLAQALSAYLEKN